MAAGFLLIAVLVLAFANGANDNFKGVATLHGSGRLGYRPALLWATAATLAGSGVAVFLGSHLVATFSGKGIVPDELVGHLDLVVPVAGGAGLTVLLATAFGSPISTTHALVGGLCGAGVAIAGSQVQLARLGAVAFVPLLVSPIVACFGTFFVYRQFRRFRRVLGVQKESCVCVALQPVARAATPSGTDVLFHALPPIVAHKTGCRANHVGRLLGIDAQFVLDSLHFLSTGAVSFARGLNDTPKIVALLTAGSLLGIDRAVLWVAVAMAIGGILGARRVAHTMSHAITTMNDGQGFSANLVTAGLVLVASQFGMPVSTTHVSVGSIFGIGAATGGGRRNAILGILVAWLLTLPLAALLAFGLATILRSVL